MKRMSTTSNRRQLWTRLSLGGISVVVAIATPIAYFQKALADQWDSQISSLQAQANQYQQQEDALRAQGDTLQNKLDQINAQVSALQAQIQVNQAKHNQLQDNIAANQLKLQSSQNALGNTLAATQADQQNLVNQTRGQEAAYQNLVSSAKNQLQSVLSQQQAYYASLVAKGAGNSGVVGSFQYWGWSGNQGCGGGGYPYCGGQDTYTDPWNLYNRECVSYVAWALANRFHKSVGAFHGDGNAMNWPSSAPANSGAYRVSSPQPGDAVILPADGYFAPIGHAMVVESVSGDNVFVSQYNMYGTGQYSTMYIKTSGVIFLRFPSA